MNYYVVLGVARTADAEAIRSAFRALARQYHPDAGSGSSAQKFREVVEAYETLSDPVRRRQYDASLRPVRSPADRIEPLLSWPHGPIEPLVLDRRDGSPWRSVDSRRAPSDLFEELFRSIERMLRDL